MDYPEIYKYQVDKNTPLPTGEPVEKLNEEAYPEYYHGPKEEYQQGTSTASRVYPKDKG